MGLRTLAAGHEDEMRMCPGCAEDSNHIDQLDRAWTFEVCYSCPADPTFQHLVWTTWHRRCLVKRELERERVHRARAPRIDPIFPMGGA